jgi:hypothetical protein
VIRRAAGRLLCRLGRHTLRRCEGKQDHDWFWNGDRWEAKVSPSPEPRRHG